MVGNLNFNMEKNTKNMLVCIANCMLSPTNVLCYFIWTQ
jgi:hypothetical protein